LEGLWIQGGCGGKTISIGPGPALSEVEGAGLLRVGLLVVAEQAALGQAVEHELYGQCGQ